MKILLDTRLTTQAAFQRLLELGYPLVKPPMSGHLWMASDPPAILDLTGSDRFDGPRYSGNFQFVFDRTNPLVIQVAEELGESAGVRAVEIPDDVAYDIQSLIGGHEYAYEVPRKWGFKHV